MLDGNLSSSGSMIVHVNTDGTMRQEGAISNNTDGWYVGFGPIEYRATVTVPF
jgi:hypothetical protein